MISVTWSVRSIPLQIEGVYGRGNVAQMLAGRLVEREDVLGVVTKDCIAVFANDLPWTDGVAFLGSEPGAVGLFIDTRLQPSVPIALLSSLCLAKFGEPVIWLPNLPLLGLGGLARFDRSELEKWSRR